MQSIGYLGLGNMGGPMARRLQLQYELHVHDANDAAMQRLGKNGAVECSSARELAERCNVIVMCLPTSDHVQAVLFGEGGIAERAKPGTLIIDQTTADPARTRKMAAELAEREIELIDAPVSGGPQGAEEGTVAIMVGGTPEQFGRAKPILSAISPNLFHAGAVGAGHVAKLANNLLSASHRAVTMEALALGAKNGVDPKVLVDILLAGSGRNFFIERFVRSSVISGKLATGFSLNFMHKDIKLATQLGVDSGVPMFCGNTVKDFFQVCMNIMGRDAEVNSMALVMDQLAGTHVVPADYSLT